MGPLVRATDGKTFRSMVVFDLLLWNGGCSVTFSGF